MLPRRTKRKSLIPSEKYLKNLCYCPFSKVIPAGPLRCVFRPATACAVPLSHPLPLSLNTYIWPKVGAILKKVSIEAIPILYYLGKVSVKWLYRCKSQKFERWSYTSAFYAKNLNWESNCIVSNPRIFNGEAIQVLLQKQFETAKQLYCFKPQIFNDKAIQVLF